MIGGHQRDQLAVVVVEHVHQGCTPAHGLALLVLPGRQCSVFGVPRDLFHPALKRNGGAFGVTPWIEGERRWWSGHERCHLGDWWMARGGGALRVGVFTPGTDPYNAGHTQRPEGIVSDGEPPGGN